MYLYTWCICIYKYIYIHTYVYIYSVCDSTLTDCEKGCDRESSDDRNDVDNSDIGSIGIYSYVYINI
jgi:hypothetical protein